MGRNGLENALEARSVYSGALKLRQYWARFILHLALGCLAGFVVGEVVQAMTQVPGYGLFVATVGSVAGTVAFMLRGDT